MLAMNPVRQVAAVAFPWRHESGAVLRWSLHVLFCASVLAGLWYVNRWGGLERVLRSPWPMLHRSWLPLLGMGIYGLAWLSRGLWLSLRRDEPASPWPDLDAAWDDACAALAGAQIDVRKAPLFIVLGPRHDDIDALLTATGAVALSSRVDRPIHVFAQPGGILLACGGLGSPARLEHWCRRVARDRPGRLPIQGIVLAIPSAALQGDAEAARAASAAESELRAVSAAVGLELPLHLVVTGLDVGAARQAFPPAPDLDPAEVPAMYRAGVDWLCAHKVGKDTVARLRLDATAENARLVTALAALRGIRHRLARWLIEGTRNEYSEPGLVAGCHLATTAAPAAAAKSLWRDLLAHEQTALWTGDALATRARRRREAWIAAALGVLGTCIGLAGIGWFVASRQF